MSGHIYEAYRVISDDQRKKLCVRVGQGTAQYYREDGQKVNIGMKASGSSNENSYLLGNINGWDRRVHRTVISQHISLRKDGVKALFEGSGRIADKTGHLGLAALWQCSASGINGCQVIDLNLSYQEAAALHGGQDFEADFRLKLPAGTLGGMLRVSYIVYLKSASQSADFGLAKKVGTRLGAIAEELVIHVDGEASSFPIDMVTDKDGPLWWVQYNDDMDPFTDSFSENNICLVLNDGHQDYASLGDYNTPLFREVFASALEDIFRRLLEAKESEGLLDINIPAEEGSVATAVRYMADTFSLKLGNEDDRHMSIRRAVARQMAGGAA